MGEVVEIWQERLYRRFASIVREQGGADFDQAIAMGVAFAEEAELVARRRAAKPKAEPPKPTGQQQEVGV